MQVKLIPNGSHYEIMQCMDGHLQRIFSYVQLFTYTDAVKFCKSLHFKIIKLKGDDQIGS
jgi:hypothetical protein